MDKPLLDIVNYFFKLKKFSAKNNLNNYDIIYIQSLEFGLLDFGKIKAPIFYFSRSTIRGIYNCHRQYGIKTNITKKIINVFLVILEKRLLHHCHNIFVKSNLMAEELVKFYNIQSRKIIVITGGIDGKDFNKICSEEQINDFRKMYGIDSDDRIIAYAGRIIPQKGLMYLIQSLKLLKNEINFHLLIAGTAVESSYYNSILKFIKENNLNDKVSFAGYINQFNVFKLLNISSVVVLPSLYEPFGMINMQAAILDKAIVTTKSVGSNDLLDEYQKIVVVNPGSSRELADGIKKAMLLYDTKNDNNFHAYSWERVANKILGLFQESIR